MKGCREGRGDGDVEGRSWTVSLPRLWNLLYISWEFGNATLVSQNRPFTLTFLEEIDFRKLPYEIFH